jgi:hypothetical protein
MDERHRVSRNVIGKLILPHEPGVGSIHNRLPVHRVRTPGAFRHTEIGKDKSDGAMFWLRYEF